MDEIKNYPARMDYPNLCKPYSNADRIRSMTDEELAMQIVKNIHMHAWPDSVRKIYFSYDRPSKDNSKKAWIEWLQQPAEGE